MTLSAHEFRAQVTFRRQCSDGNYGSETVEVTVDVPLDGEGYDLSEEAIAASLATARRLVHDELRNSPSATVVRAISYASPPPLPTRAEVPAPDDLSAEPAELPF